MKKVAAVFLAIVLLITFASVAPVFAKTSKMISVTFTRSGSHFTLGPDFWTTEGDTYHSRGSLYGFTTYRVIGEGVNLNGFSEDVMDQNLNNKTHVGNQHWETRIVFPDGTFEGVTNTKGTYRDYLSKTYLGMLAPLNVTTKGMYHGTGAYQGWTLMLESGFVNAAAIPATGYLLIPNEK